jgi:hypothetical protein
LRFCCGTGIFEFVLEVKPRVTFGVGKRTLLGRGTPTVVGDEQEVGRLTATL